MTMGLQDLMMFRDNLQNPQRTAMQRLKDLDDLTKLSMISEDYMNEPMMNTGLMSLPVAQAGFGGFIKSITKGITGAVKGVAKGIKNFAKSDVGRLAIAAAPMFLGLPPIVANPALNAAIYSGGTTLLTGGKPEDALKSAVISGGLTGLTQGFSTPKGSKGLFSGAKTTPAGMSTTGNIAEAGTGTQSLLERASYQPGSPTMSSFAPAPGVSPESFLQGNIAEANIPQAEMLNYGTPTDLTQPQSLGAVTTPDNITQQLGAPPPTIGQRIAELGGTTLDKTQAALKAGFDFAKDNKALTALGGAALLSGLGAGQQIPQQQLAMVGLTPVETDFDKQQFTYRDRQGNILTRDEALALIQQASQNVGAGGQKVASGVTYDINKIKSGGPVDPVLSASGGLIGMMYGGQAMPENNMDVKYKEFSGMVGGRGDGMEDNVYMPIVEGESGQQVATLAVSPKEYVVDANTMSLLGNGNPDEGAEIMDQTVKDIRKKATGQTKQQKEIDGLAALNRMRRSV